MRATSGIQAGVQIRRIIHPNTFFWHPNCPWEITTGGTRAAQQDEPTHWGFIQVPSEERSQHPRRLTPGPAPWAWWAPRSLSPADQVPVGETRPKQTAFSQLFEGDLRKKEGCMWDGSDAPISPHAHCQKENLPLRIARMTPIKRPPPSIATQPASAGRSASSYARCQPLLHGCITFHDRLEVICTQG